MSEPGAWRRLYPLSPIVRGGRGTIGIVILLVPALLRGGISAGDLVPLGVIALITLLGFVSWFVTRWTIDGDDLRIETGVLRRRSLRFPLSQVQAIDILRPGLGRLLGAAELRLRMGGSSGGAARLSYVAAGEVEAAPRPAAGARARRAARPGNADGRGGRRARADDRSHRPADRVDPDQRRRLLRRGGAGGAGRDGAACALRSRPP